jgi:hypothetical protein
VSEFLSLQRREFEPRRAQLLACSRVSLLEVLSEIRAEETRLHGAGLLEVPFVLAARAPTTPSAAPVFSRNSANTHCDYCNRDGHPESDCFKKQHRMRNVEHSSSTGTRASSPTSSATSFTNIVKLLRLLAASSSPSIGSAGLAADSSSSENHLLHSQECNMGTLVGPGHQRLDLGA